MSDIDDPRVPWEPRSPWQNGLFALALLFVLLAQFVSDRPIGFVNRPAVVDVAPLPAKADEDRYRLYVEANTVLLPKLKRPNFLNIARRISQAVNPPPPAIPHVRLGYSIREVDAFSMPLFFYKEAGYILYIDDWDSDEKYLRVAGVDDAGLAVLRKETGAPIGEGWIFPFWMHLWGWVAVIAGGLWGWLQWRRYVRRREQLGII
jgi:hypothetical protein